MLCGTCAPVRRRPARTAPSAAPPDGAVARGPGLPPLLLPGARREGPLPAVRRAAAVDALPRRFDCPGLLRLRGVPPHHVCGRCGDEDAPYHRGLCPRCVTKDRLTSMLGDQSSASRARTRRAVRAVAVGALAQGPPRWLRKSPDRAAARRDRPRRACDAPTRRSTAYPRARPRAGLRICSSRRRAPVA